MDSGKKMLNTRYLITLFLLLFASFQTAQAKVIYNAEETVAGKLESPESLTIYDDFAVKKGTTYIATLTDLGTVDNFDGLSMVILKWRLYPNRRSINTHPHTRYWQYLNII